MAERKNYKTVGELNNKLKDVKKPSLEGGRKIQLKKILKTSLEENYSSLSSFNVETVKSIIYDRWSDNINLNSNILNISNDLLFEILKKQSNLFWNSSSSPEECGQKMKNFMENKNNTMLKSLKKRSFEYIDYEETFGEDPWPWIIWILLIIYTLFIH